MTPSSGATEVGVEDIVYVFLVLIRGVITGRVLKGVEEPALMLDIRKLRRTQPLRPQNAILSHTLSLVIYFVA